MVNLIVYLKSRASVLFSSFQFYSLLFILTSLTLILAIVTLGGPLITLFNFSLTIFFSVHLAYGFFHIFGDYIFDKTIKALLVCFMWLIFAKLLFLNIVVYF